MKKLYICAAALVMSLAACNNEEFVEVGQQEGIQTITADIVQSESRINISELQNDRYPLTWSAATNTANPDAMPNGDFLSVFGTMAGSEEVSCVWYYCLGGDNQTSGEFGIPKGWGEPLDKISYAIANVGLGYEGQSIPFNNAQTVSSMDEEPGFRGERFPMYGEVIDGKLCFHQVIGMLKLNLNLEGGFKKGDNLIVTCDKNHIITGTGKIEIPNGVVKDCRLVLNKEEGDRMAAFPVKVAKDGTASVYATLPLGEYDNLSFKIVRAKKVGTKDVEYASNTLVVQSKTGGKISIDKNVYAYNLSFKALVGPEPIKASLLGMSSRTAIVDDKFCWASGDEISVFKSAADFANKIDFGVNLPSNVETGSDTEEFLTAKVYNKENVVYGVHPKGLFTKGGADYLDVSISQSPNIKTGLKDLPMFGQYDEADQVVKFRPAMGYLDITLPDKWWESKDDKGATVTADVLIVETDRPIAAADGKKAQLSIVDGVGTVVIPEELGAKSVIFYRGYSYAAYKGNKICCLMPDGDYNLLKISTAKKVYDRATRKYTYPIIRTLMTQQSDTTPVLSVKKNKNAVTVQ